MSRLITIRQASELSGLSVTTLRRRVSASTLPYTRANTATQRGKILFDADLLMDALKNEIVGNLNACDPPTPKPSELSQLFKPSSDPWEADAERNKNFGYHVNTKISGSFTK